MFLLITALVAMGPTHETQLGGAQLFRGNVLPVPHACSDMEPTEVSDAQDAVITAPFVFRDRMAELTAQEIRHTNPTGSVDASSHRIPDILAYQLGNWRPNDANDDLYEGCWDPNANFFRFDIAFNGLVNPPGFVMPGNSYDPYKYGPNPVFGFVEFDMDNKVNSGGEVDAPQNRYLGNVARFGGVPNVARLADRVAKSHDDLDGVQDTPPHVERSGEEFHIALLGRVICDNENCDGIIIITGDDDCEFEMNEVWVVPGRWLHRAHGYEQYSGAGGDGQYEPVLDLRIASIPEENKTVMSIVYPLNNVASAAMTDDPGVEGANGDDQDQNSIEEALIDLEISAANVSNAPPIIADWASQSAADFLDSEAWHVNASVGMAYVSNGPPSARFAWTDIVRGPVPGDFNADGLVTMLDVSLLDGFIQENDGDPSADEDQNNANASVDIIDFGPNFSVYDLNYDGIVDINDKCAMNVLGDMNRDLNVNIDDVSGFVRALLGQSAIPAPGLCPIGSVGDMVERGDFDRDGTINGGDIRGFLETLTGGSTSP